jgi:predicted Fe-Mo cluster-binding NifX family protein
MKIAVPVTGNNQIDDHFGHCEYYNIFTISDKNEIVNTETIPSLQGCGCKSNIAHTLALNGVKVMLAGGIGAGAINVLNASGIEVIRGCSGLAASVIENYLAGNINDSGESCHQHEAHHSGNSTHQCNHHGRHS